MRWLGQSWLMLLLDVSAKSLILAVLGAAALLILRVQNANVRHRVWTAVLLGMLAMPLLVPVTPTIPLPSWLTPVFTTPLRDDGSASAQVVAVNGPSANIVTMPDPSTDANSWKTMENGFTDRLIHGGLPPDNFENVAFFESSMASAAPVADTVSREVLLPEENTREAVSVRLLRGWPTALCIVYAAVALGLFLRMGNGLWGAARIVARAERADLQGFASTVPVYESNELRVPLTAGCFRPKILLPIEWRTWSTTKLHAVLVHESEHIRRGDYLVTVLAEFNGAIHWFHPLAWLLRRWLSDLAEQNCDDAVIASTGERTQYARHLLEVASSLKQQRGRLAWAGVAMARKANVESRIDTILDARRPLAKRLGMLGGLLLIAVAVPAVLLAAALGPGGAQVTDDVAARSGDAAAADTSDVVLVGPERIDEGPRLPTVVAGRVVDPNGKPLAGATVYAEQQRVDPRSIDTPIRTQLAEDTSDSEGGFTLDLGDDAYADGTTMQIVAFANGYGAIAVEAMLLKEHPQPTLRLVHDKPVEGRVLDTEGKPIHGITVRIARRIVPSSDEAVDEWIANEQPELLQDRDFFMDDRARRTQFPTEWSFLRLSSKSRALPDEVVTAADGRFRFAGIGRNHLAILQISGSSIAKQEISVVARRMKPIVAYPHAYHGPMSTVHYGATLNFVAQPTQPIVGRVVDRETGEPLVDVKVRTNQIEGSIMNQGDFLNTMTNDRGEFRLEGAPQGGGHEVTVVPGADLPYFETSQRLPKVTGSSPIDYTFELPKATWVVGNVTDQSGRPVQATVHYYPYRDNTFAEGFANYNPDITGAGPDEDVRTDAVGHFRIQAIPGKGVLAAHVVDRKQQAEYLSDVPADLFERIGGEQMPRLYNSWSAKWFHTLRELDIEAKATEITHHLQLTKGERRTIDIVDPAGRPLHGARVLGRTFPPQFEPPSETSEVTVVGMTVDDERLVIVLHEDKDLGRARTITPGNDRVELKLEPCATVTGRIVDEEGQPVAGIDVGVHPIQKRDNWHRGLVGARTGDDGRFRVLLPPGNGYYVSAYSRLGPNFTARIDPRSGAAYELGDLADGAELDEATTAKLIVQARPVPTRSIASQDNDSEWRLLGQTQTILSSGVTRNESKRIKGQVLGPDGIGRTATVHVVAKRTGEGLQPGSEAILQQFTTDRQGRFDLDASLPVRDDAIDMGIWNAQVVQLVATADGFGPAVSHVIGARKGEEVMLQLASDDVPIEGQIFDLEGQPVAGATIRVGILDPSEQLDKLLDSLRERAKDKPNQMLMGSFIAMEDFLSSEIDVRRNEVIVADKLHYSRLGPASVTTDARGHFKLHGIGRDRVVALEVSGPRIVTSWVSVVTREMDPINASIFVGGRTNVTYGSRFTVSAEPSQIVQGTITDVDTGEPIVGVKVESNPHDSGYAASITDAQGRYQLEGIPKQERHHLNIITPSNSAYFSRDYVELTDVADGLEPTKFDVKMKKAIWITGTVTDKRTGSPVIARVVFSPHIENKYAEHYPELRRGVPLDPIRTPRAAVTDDQGRFRLRAIPGEGLVAVKCEDDGDCVGIGRETLTDRWLGFEQRRMTNTFNPMFPEWMHLLYTVDVAEAGATGIDLKVDPGETLAVRLVDNQDRPLSGVVIRGRVPQAFRNDPPLEADEVTIRGVDSNNPRPVFFYHADRNLGACLIADQQRSEQRTVRLRSCATLKARMLTKSGQPLAGVLIGMKLTALQDKPERALPIGKTDKDGRFEATRIIPHLQFGIYPLTSPEPGQIGETLELEPGQTVDLGTVELDMQAPPQSSGFQLGGNESDDDDQFTNDVGGVDTTVAPVTLSPKAVPTKPLVYEGQVLKPDGTPAAGARIYLSNWYNTPYKELPAKPRAVTNAQGRFRFERASSDNQEMDYGNIVATLAGFGFAWAFAPAVESTGQLEAKLRGSEWYSWTKQSIDGDRGPLRLVADDGVIRGRVVDLEGNGVAGVEISVTEVYAGLDDSLAAMDKAMRAPDFDFGRIHTVLRRHIYGPEVPSLFARGTTANDGAFQIRGIGKDRLTKLALRGANIQSVSVYLRTDGGATIDLPMWAGSPDLSVKIQRNDQFTHVATPSRPVVGAVVDEKTRNPIAGAVVTSTMAWTYSAPDGPSIKIGSDEAFAVTDASGQFRLDGLPKAKSNPIHVQAMTGDYLPTTSTVDTPGEGIAPVEQQFSLAKGTVVTGQVTDAKSGEGIQGMIEFLPITASGRMVAMFGRDMTQRADSDGNFRVVVPKAEGHVCFTAFNRDEYPKVLRSEPDKPETTAVGEVMAMAVSANRFHAFRRIHADAPEGKVSVEWKLEPASVAIVHATDAQGNRLANVSYVGRSPEYPFWTPSAAGELKIFGFDENHPRQVAIIQRERRLAGFRLMTKAADDFSVKLERWSTIKGRVVDADGDSLAGVRIRAGSVNARPIVAFPGPEMPIANIPPLPLPALEDFGNREHVTDEDGRFEILGLVPHYAYTLSGQHLGDPRRPIAGDLVNNLKLTSGETRDLGTIVLKPSQR